jgi:transcriptional regulator with XRE-family HTH domain
MLPTVPAHYLRHAREEAGMKQAILAERLGVSVSVVSRLENADSSEPTMTRRYLEAVGTETSQKVLDFYVREWRHIERPPFNHPNREDLWLVESALHALEVFESGPEFDSILETPLKILRARLRNAAEFLLRIDHGIAWVGDIGVGKTTALSLIANLMLPDDSGKLRSVFPTGGGRVTVCEVVIKVAPVFGITIESLPEEQIRLLVTDLINGIKEKRGGVTTEIDKVIRNMADLRRRLTRTSDGRRVSIDPVAELAKTQTIEELVAYIVGRMDLPSRTETQLILSEDSENGLSWLSNNINQINFGQHPGFSVPQRILVLLPPRFLSKTVYSLSIVDTKGVEGTTQRPDLRSQWDDQRTLTVLCCRFNDAPEGTPEKISREIRESGSDAVEQGRLLLLVLPRDGEAMEVKDDNGELPSNVEDAYAIKEGHIERAWTKHDLPQIPTLFLNASTEDPNSIWTALCSQLDHMRALEVQRVKSLSEAADDLITNCDIAKTRQARAEIAKTMHEVTARLNHLPPTVRAAHANLVEQIVAGHASSIAAAANRKGSWLNFPMDHILGVGVRRDAYLRSHEYLIRIDEQLSGLADRFQQLSDVRRSLEVIRDDLKNWRQEFLVNVYTIGKTLHKPHLEAAAQLWLECQSRWGAGSGYRSDIAALVQTWFENDPGLAQMRQSLESSINSAWRELVLNRLEEVCSVDEKTEH